MKTLVLASTFLIIFSFFKITSTSAANPPTILNPQHNDTITDSSPKLEWEYNETCPPEGSCFKVEVSKLENFSDLEKSVYVNNTHYTPSLYPSKWYWRVKAKDQESNWSTFQTSSFTITELQSSSTPYSTSSPTSSSPTPSSTEKTSSEFFISSSTTQFTSDSIAKVDIKITGLQPNTNYFLKGAFFKEGKTNYFGKTKIREKWIKNNAAFSEQFKITSTSERNWQGTIEVQIDREDSGFEESGSYFLKIGRYSNTGSGPAWSNSIPVTITAEKPGTKEEETIDEVSPIIIDKDTSSEMSTNTTTSSLTTNELFPTPSSLIIHSLPNLESSVAEEATSSEQTKVMGQKKINWWFISCGLLFLIVTSILVVHIRKKRYYQS